MSPKGVSTWVVVAAVILLSACTNPVGNGSDPTPPASSEPAAPALLLPSDGAAGTGNLVTLDWEESAGATSYDVFLGTDSSPVTLASGGDEITSTELAVSGLSYDTTYFWFVRAQSAEGSADSDVYSFSTGPAPTSPPGQTSTPSPADTAVGVAPDIALQWEAADGAESYTLFFGIGSVPGTATATAITALTYDPGTLTPDAEYYWRVDAVNSEGTTSGPEWTFSVADAASLAPAAPGSVTATVSAASASDTIDLTWSDNSSDETGFEIERSDTGGASWSAVSTTAANATTYVDSGLDPETTYRFRVRAVNEYSESAWVGNDGDATATTDVSPYVYVSWDGGSDTTGSGTTANPYASVTKGLAEASAGQVIRVAGSTGSEEYSEAPMLWKTQVSLEGGWSPDLSTHDPSMYETVIRADIAAGTEHLIKINLANGPIEISHVTLINHSTTNNQDPVVWISGSGDITLDTVVVEADGPVSASAIRTDGSGTSDVVVRNSTIRTLSIPTADSGSNWAYGVVADKFFGSLTIEDTDITVNAAHIAAAVRQDSGHLTITGGSLTNAVTTEGSSRGVWVSGGESLSMDGVAVTTSDSNTGGSEGVRAASITTSVEVLNSDITIGAGGGGSGDHAIGIRAGSASDRIILRGNTVTFTTAAVGNSGNFIGIDINDTASGSTLKIDRNTVVFGADADGNSSANGIDLVDTNNVSASTLEVTNNLIYREDGNDTYFAGVVTNLTSTTVRHDIFIANNTIVSLDSTGTGRSFGGIWLKAGSGSEIVNNIIQAGGEPAADSIGVYVNSFSGDYPARVESNFIDANYLFDYVTTITEVNDATRVTHDSNSDGDGDGTATGNVTALTTAFANAANGDFDLTASSAAALRTGGASLSAVFDTDIDGIQRSTGGANGSDWSIGAFEY